MMRPSILVVTFFSLTLGGVAFAELQGGGPRMYPPETSVPSLEYTAQPPDGVDLLFVERYALAEDREAVLKELVPGTEPYYYFTSLYLQEQGAFDDVDALLKTWVKRYDESRQVVEIRNRQALLRYGKQPADTVAYLTSLFGLTFDHQPQIPGAAPDLPTVLDPALISRETLLQRVLDKPGDSSTIDGFRPGAYSWLLATDLSPARRHNILKALTLPDYPRLAELIARDLHEPGMGSFGTLDIHTRLTKEQLDALLALKPDLLDSDAFIKTYLLRLVPSNDAVNWQQDPEAMGAYLERLGDFVERLSPAYSGRKAQVAYHRLAFDQTQGVYDVDRFLAYLKIPRRMSYVNPDFLQKGVNANHLANLDEHLEGATALSAVGHDEALVGDYLRHFFESADDYARFTPYIREDYLRTVFAEVKLLQGEGDLEQWYSWLTPDVVDALKNRVDVAFVPENKQQFGLDEAVSVGLWVKNVDRLLVKVFEIDTKNYYQEFQQEINTAIELDGLVANDEQVYTYDEGPLRRHRQEFTFPEITGRGVWVIEFVGNGTSSRAVVAKGSLQYLRRTSPVGQVFTLFDETGAPVPDGSIWFNEHRYPANSIGEIILPFSTNGGTAEILLCQDDFATRTTFYHAPEVYRLDSTFHVDSESLRAGETAQLAVRPLLYLNGTPVPLSLMKDASLEITSFSHDGIESRQQIENVALKNDEATLQNFSVPENLAKLTFSLRGTVPALTRDAPFTPKSEESIDINGIYGSAKTAALFLSQSDAGFAIELRDLSGNPIADRVIAVQFSHGDFSEPVQVKLKTDDGGQVHLGALDEIAWVNAACADATENEFIEGRWTLPSPTYTYPKTLQGSTRVAMRIPYLGEAKQKVADIASLLELRGDNYVADHTEALRLEEGYLLVSGLAAGDYLLHLKESTRKITLRFSDGDVTGSYVASPSRLLDGTAPTALQIQSVSADDTSLRIQCGGVNAFTRVHVVATRFLPERRLANGMFVSPLADPESRTVSGDYALYTSSRQIGDEYRYILDRRFADIFPGNMLDRPSLLLNPWAIEETDAAQEDAKEGAPMPLMEADSAPVPPSPSSAPSPARTAYVGPPFSPNYDFLGGDAAVFYNLVPDATGGVTIPMEDLQGRGYLQIVATDPTATVSRTEALAAQPWRPRDLRLAKGLDPEGHVVEQKASKVLDSGEALSISLTGDADVQVYDSVPSVLGLLMTLNSDSHLRDFSFVGRWPQLSAEEKLAKFSKYESHELNFFLYHKDRAFFDETVRPFLANKYEKTFLDHWLLEEDLAAYQNAWEFAQLNRVEQVLLARRMPTVLPALAQQLQDALNMVPPNPERANTLFMTALHGGALKQGGGVEIDGFLRIRGNFYDADDNGGGMAIRTSRQKADVESTPLVSSGAQDSAFVGSQPMPADLPASNLYYLNDAELIHAREEYRALYRTPERTQAYIETNYYQRRIEETHGEMIPVNAFWRDYANASPEAPFLSAHLVEVAGSFTEAMLALAVLDLPFESPKHAVDSEEGTYTFRAGGRAVTYFKDIEAATLTSDETTVLVSQNYFREGDRFRFEGNQQYDKFVTDEFLTGVVYGCQVMVTNTTSAPHQIEVLHQIPTGALPVHSGRYSNSTRTTLGAYGTSREEYFFFFPAPGVFDHFPVHVSENSALLAFAPAHQMTVVAEPSTVDTTSWAYLSQQASSEEVLTYLKTANLNRIDLSQILWRMKDADFYHATIDLLTARLTVVPELWAYGFKHNDADAMGTYLQHRSDFVEQSGPYVDSALLTIDPVARKMYQHIEYAPLINPRAHHPEGKWMITNTQLELQYRAFLNVLAHRPSLRQEDLLALSYYLLLQDRVGEGLACFARVSPDALPTRVQYDYLQAYLNFYEENPVGAAEIAARYTDYPVLPWRERFAALAAQAAEITGSTMAADGVPLTQDALAAEEAQLDMEIMDGGLQLYYQNLTECTVSFYPIDLEMLFTRSPFALAGTNVIAGVKPLSTLTVSLDGGQSQVLVPLPTAYANSHVVIKVESGGISRSDIRYSSHLVAQLVERYGQVQVSAKADNKALSRVYVKVFAKLKNGQTLFYRDGYTDLRGRFDYASSSTMALDDVTEFAILVLSEEHGAKVLLAEPPAR